MLSGLEALARIDRRLLESALEGAVNRNIVSARLLDERIKLADRLRAHGLAEKPW